MAITYAPRLLERHAEYSHQLGVRTPASRDAGPHLDAGRGLLDKPQPASRHFYSAHVNRFPTSDRS